MSEHRAIVRSASIVTLITLVSRVSGLVREQRYASLLGVGTVFDAFVIAYRIPNMLRRLVGEGAVSAAFIPIFSEHLAKRDRKEAFEFANAVLTLTTLGLAVAVILGIVFSPVIVRVLALGWVDTPGKLELTTYLNRIMFPYILLVSVSALAMGVLNSFDRFAAPAFAPVLFNLSIIGMSFVTGWFSDPETALAVGVVVGGVLQIAVQVPGLWRSGWRFLPSFDWKSPAVGRVARLMGPVVLGTGVVQVNVVVGGLFASYLEEGAVSALNLSDRVMELVLGGYAIAIATVILPLMSRQAASRAIDEMKQTLNFASRLVLFITIPSTIGLVVLREPIIRVLFQHGEFGPDATRLTAWPLLFYAVGLSAFAMIKIVVPAFHSMQDTRTPVMVAFLAMILNVAFNFAFFRPLQVGGPALATSLAALFNAAALVYLFVQRQGSIGTRAILSSLARFGVAAAALGLAAHTIIGWPGFYDGQSFPRQVVALAAAVLAGAGVYFGVALLLRCREIGELRRVFSRSGP